MFLLAVEVLHAALVRVDRAVVRPVAFGPDFDQGAWDENARITGYSMMTEIFQGQQRNNDDAHEHFFALTLDPKPTIEKSLHAYMTDDTVRREFTRLPLVLCVQLNKLDTKSFVSYNTNLVVPEVGGHKVSYTLFACMLHHGTRDDGHWTALCMHDDQWHHFDDEERKPVTDVNDVIQLNAVMLLYKRIVT